MEKFAKLCGRSKGYISMLENGINPKSGKPIIPSIETVAQIASAMQISVEELLRKTESTEDTYSEVTPKSLKVKESSEAYNTDEFLVYYDGSNFVPVVPLLIPENQPAIVKILDKDSLSPKDTARQTLKQLRGCMSESGMSSEVFTARKKYEKDLEK